MRRFFALGLFLALFILNEWAFRFLFPLQPIDQFMRLMVGVLDLIMLPVILIGATPNFLENGLLPWIRSRPRISAIWLGIFISYCLFMTLEFSCRYYFKHHFEPPYVEQKTWEPALHLPDPQLGHHLPKNGRVTHTLVVNDTLVYEVDYTTDAKRRRVSTHSDSLRKGRPLVLDGCSFAFSWGVPDSLTLDAQLAGLFPDRRVVNLATSGYGTQHVFMHTRDPYYLDDVPGPVTFYYLFIDDHVRRLNGSRRLVGLWAENFPYLGLEDGRVLHHGSFSKSRYWRTLLWKCLGKSAIVWMTDLDIPWYDSDEMMALTAETISASQAALRRHHPNSGFVVVTAPGSLNSARLIPLLTGLNVETLDLSDLLDPSDPSYRLHWTEAHPNGFYYQKIASAIFSSAAEGVFRPFM